MSLPIKIFNKLKKIRMIWESKSHNDFVHQLDLESSFIDYFMIIGLDPKISVNNYLYNTSPEYLDKNYKNEIKPEILTKFPPFNKSYVDIDNDSIISLCFPNGFHLEEHENIPNPKIFNFLFDNNFYSVQHPQKYITCLLFYENLKNYFDLKLKIEEELNDEEELVKKVNNNSINDSSIISNFKINKDIIKNYYFPKVICLISIEPFYKEHEEILTQIYKYFLFNKHVANMPLEKIILNIIKNIPIPPYGIMEIKYKLNKSFKDIIIKRHQINKINNIDEYVEYILSIFSIDDFLKIFKYTLFETKIIIFSKDINGLCKFIYGLINLLFPFKYPYQVSSCLPNFSYDCIESISPYIFGINENYSEDLLQKYLKSKNTNIIIVDIDNKTIIEKLIEKFPDIPKALSKKIKNKIKKLQKERSLNSSKNSEKDKNEGNNEDIDLKSISYIFFNSFFINLIIDYSEYIKKSDLKNKNKIYNINNLFKINDFVNSFVITDKSFYKKFVETQMFNEFIYKKMLPNNIDETIDILFFDESIIKKKNKMKLTFINKKTPFLSSLEYNYIQTYIIPETKPLTTEEKDKFDDTEFLFNNLLNGIFIENDKFKKNNDDKQNNNKIENNIFFNYFVFPRLSEQYFYEIKDEYFSFSSMKEDIHHINTDILSKSENSHFKGENNNENMINYIYLTYIELWAYSLWYHENIEKIIKFKQLLNIIDKINNHEIELYDLLFESLKSSGEEEKILQLYDKLFSLKISPSSYIYSLIESIKKNKKYNNITPVDGTLQRFKRFLSFKKNSSNKKDDLNNIIYKFKLRTFRSADEFNILGEKVHFETNIKCSGCSRIINIYNLSQNNRNLIKNELWARCPYCKVYFQPLLNIYLGIFDPYKKLFNCKMTKFCLLSPYELKKNIKNIFNEKKNKKLDIDNFKINYPDLFWSSVYYFFSNKIDFSFFLPYENNLYNNNKKNLTATDIETKFVNNNIDDIKIKKVKIKSSKNKCKTNNLIIQNLISFNFI